MTPLIPDDGDDVDLDARLRSYEAARRAVAVAEEVLEWMTWRAIEGLQRNRVYNPKDVAARLGIRQRDVIRRMLPPAQAQFYSRELSAEARKQFKEILRQTGDVDRERP